MNKLIDQLDHRRLASQITQVLNELLIACILICRAQLLITFRRLIALQRRDDIGLKTER